MDVLWTDAVFHHAWNVLEIVSFQCMELIVNIFCKIQGIICHFKHYDDDSIRPGQCIVYPSPVSGASHKNH